MTILLLAAVIAPCIVIALLVLWALFHTDYSK